MIAVDTNVLVRLMVNDEPSQAGRAKQLFDAKAGEDGSIWVSDTVLVELVWTLARAYGRSRTELATAVRALASHATLTLESAVAVRAAVDVFEGGAADFSDCLLAAKAQGAGCEHLFTFDKGMRALAGVKLL
ncbi:MAG: type II toxin-antitoxin system VapC family toxin [Aquabacterium sp.]|nr:type II toxin-antitoxin system VapC family toxin [Aquabacterium sp.]